MQILYPIGAEELRMQLELRDCGRSFFVSYHYGAAALRKINYYLHIVVKNVSVVSIMTRLSNAMWELFFLKHHSAAVWSEAVK